MYHVKLSIAGDNAGCARQLPGRNIVYKDYCFHINEDIEEADFWVVYSKGRRITEHCNCSPENTVFITGEPETVYHYSSGFVRQFAKVLSVQNSIRHGNMKMYQPAQPWHIGKISPRNVEGKEAGDEVRYVQDYDSLSVSHPEKTKLMSIITSNKCFTKGHKARIAFAGALKEHYGEHLDLFGHGFNSFEDKWDVIAPYRYHICIENSSYPHYWTEKLSDAYLGNSYPFYYGAPNIGEYFPEDSYTMIDINDIDKSIRIIDDVISRDVATINAKAVEEAKQRVLNEYNLFEVLVREFENMDPHAPKRSLTIKHDTAFIDFSKLKVMLIDRLKNKLTK